MVDCDRGALERRRCGLEKTVELLSKEHDKCARKKIPGLDQQVGGGGRREEN